MSVLFRSMAIGVCVHGEFYWWRANAAILTVYSLTEHAMPSKSFRVVVWCKKYGTW